MCVMRPFPVPRRCSRRSSQLCRLVNLESETENLERDNVAVSAELGKHESLWREAEEELNCAQVTAAGRSLSGLGAAPVVLRIPGGHAQPGPKITSVCSCLTKPAHGIAG